MIAVRNSVRYLGTFGVESDTIPDCRRLIVQAHVCVDAQRETDAPWLRQCRGRC